MNTKTSSISLIVFACVVSVSLACDVGKATQCMLKIGEVVKHDSCTTAIKDLVTCFNEFADDCRKELPGLEEAVKPLHERYDEVCAAPKPAVGVVLICVSLMSIVMAVARY